MKSLKTIFVLLTAIALFSSCQKEFDSASLPVGTPSDSSSETVSFKVKTYTEDVTSFSQHSATTYNLTYDTRDRIISIISVSSPGDKFVYEYTNNTFSVDLYNLNQLSIHSNYFINSLSLVDSSFQYNDTNDTMTEKYLYNSVKQLIQLEEYDYSTQTGAVLSNSHYYIYDNNGNMLKDSTANAIITYEYYDDLLDNLLMGTSYSRPNKNLVKTTTYTEGGIAVTINHTYTFDNYNRQTSEKAVASNGDVVIKSYIY